jgi:hypothetical protein
MHLSFQEEGVLLVSTHDDRLASLERKVAALELRRVYNEGLAQENTPLELGRTLREMNENMTILLGLGTTDREQFIAFRQEVNQRFTDLTQDMYSQFERIDKRFDAHDKRFDSIDEKLNQIVSLLTFKPE